MRLTEARQGVRMLKFMDVSGRWDAAELKQVEAVELLGVGERTFRRWCRRYQEDGEVGLLDRRIGRRWAGGCRWIGATRSSGYIERTMRASPLGISTNISYATTDLGGATAGPRSSCKAGIRCRRRSAVARTVGSGLAVPCRERCCIC